ncbi:MarR family protein [Pseudodesulfovibrio hydrargyri]|uniref:MarR family protein n=1 Tax=Pseudodesulfovibrio hydrargyri TaxID=2125990 RepID=A0A1J5NFS3_9BACT|nr:bifunctional helix-turn-helix transcriptional regulator/GNAT family N-acetyltransferase [Pseudodesulfovibrio hydrargyri]OIQ50561.1 MarR family protein [Pseudodesulfovibrio hydrargyri]
MYVSRIRGELRYLVRELGLLDKNCLDSGLTLGQAHILTYLARNGDSPFSELCERLRVDKASLSRSVEALRTRGFLRKVKGAADGRQRVVSILPDGARALEDANSAVNREMGEILNGLGGEEVAAVWRGLRLFRRAAAKRNLAAGAEDFAIERLDPAYLDEALVLVEEVFAGEQGIPAELARPGGDDVHWWCVRLGEYIIGAAAFWREGKEWHWGRFAIDGQYRGLGLGRELARRSLADFFGIAEAVVIEARDSATHILKGFGAKTTGPTGSFYGTPLTPLILHKADFAGN